MLIVWVINMKLFNKNIQNMNINCLKLYIFALNKIENNYNFRNRKLEKQIKQ